VTRVRRADGARDQATPPATPRLAPSLGEARPLPGPVLTPWVGLALLAAAAVLLYLPALKLPFFADDYLFLDQVRHRGLWASVLAPDPLSNFFRPVGRQLYFWAIAGSTHESALAFHTANLACFLGILVALFALTRRLAGDLAGLIASAFVAMHYSGDVAVRWASGSQDLLAVLGALVALLLHVQGRRAGAAGALVLAALSKEVVLLIPAIAILAARRPGEPWMASVRRAWPLGIAVALWIALWATMPHRRSAMATEVEIGLAGPLAALLHLVQVTLGAEWRPGRLGHLAHVLPPLVPMALALAALAWSRDRAPGGAAEVEPAPSLASWPDRRRAMALGISWALLAVVPVAAVAALWSAYYFLFAMCGVGLAIGAWLASHRRGWTLATLALLAWGSQGARTLDEFAVPRSPWTVESHINRFYIDRASRYNASYLASLRRRYPTLPARTTLFYAGLRGNTAFQVADGPLLRWAYRDSTLHSYYLYAFRRELIGRGPFKVFVGEQDTLRELEPDNDLFERLAFSMLLSDHPRAAREALALAADRAPGNPRPRTWLAWAEWAEGDSTHALGALAAAGLRADRGPAPGRDQALACVAARDTLGAIALMTRQTAAYALDPAAHALLADLHLTFHAEHPDGPVEAYAARVLAPTDPIAWRRWGMVQAHNQRYLEALASFGRYFDLAGPAAERDLEAHQWVEKIRGLVPGGDIAREALRE
jgi:hypothetical protein